MFRVYAVALVAGLVKGDQDPVGEFAALPGWRGAGRPGGSGVMIGVVLSRGNICHDTIWRSCPARPAAVIC